MPAAVTDVRTIARDAIAHAERVAGKDGRAFVEEFRRHALSQLPEPPQPRGANARGFVRPRSKEPTGPRLMDDPRYLTSVRELAKRTKRNARIVGGSAVAGKDFRDCVAVGTADDWGCTGTLIAPDVVLTAAHCRQFHVRIFVGNDVDGSGRVYRVRKRVRHPQFSKKYENDLMLLILEKRVTGVKPRALASASAIDAASDGRAVGFGTTDLAGSVGYGRKMQVDVPIVSSACKGKVKGKTDGAVYGCHLGKEIVAGKPFLNRDSCKGDSGGPLYVNYRGKWLLAGVVSRGTALGLTICGDGGLYTRVDRYQTWIDSVLA